MPEVSDAPKAPDHAFTRLARPQRVLDPIKPLVPTKTSLLQANKGSKSPRLHPLPPSPSTPPLSPTNPSSPPSPLALAKPLTGVATTIPTKPHGTELHVKSQEVSQIGPLQTYGTLTQNNVEWELRAQQGRTGLIMVKKVRPEIGRVQKEILGGLQHRNIAKLLHTFHCKSDIGLALEYCRFTLVEMLHVHLKLEEQQVRYIARSVSSMVCTHKNYS